MDISTRYRREINKALPRPPESAEPQIKMEISTIYGPLEVLNLIEGRLRELGMSQAQLGQRAFGKADNTAIQSLRKGSSPAFDRLDAMAQALGWEVYFGPPRETDEPKPGLAEPDHGENLGRKDAFRAGFLPLPWLEGSRNTGIPPIAFAASWFEKQSLRVDSISCVFPENSWIDGVEPGEMLAVVDKAAIRAGFGLWVIAERGVFQARRVLFQERAAVILAEDPTASPRLVTNWQASSDIRFAGKVVWVGHPPA